MGCYRDQLISDKAFDAQLHAPYANGIRRLIDLMNKTNLWAKDSIETYYYDETTSKKNDNDEDGRTTECSPDHR